MKEPVSTRARCPVCHEPVYSRAGIHPQCAVRRSEPPKPPKPKDGPTPDGATATAAPKAPTPPPAARPTRPARTLPA
jgi:hypothetical protein